MYAVHDMVAGLGSLTFQFTKGNARPMKKRALVGPIAAEVNVVIDCMTVPPNRLTAKARPVEATPKITTRTDEWTAR